MCFAHDLPKLAYDTSRTMRTLILYVFVQMDENDFKIIDHNSKLKATICYPYGLQQVVLAEDFGEHPQHPIQGP
jgi:hypothetical protein